MKPSHRDCGHDICTRHMSLRHDTEADLANYSRIRLATARIAKGNECATVMYQGVADSHMSAS